MSELFQIFGKFRMSNLKTPKRMHFNIAKQNYRYWMWNWESLKQLNNSTLMSAYFKDFFLFCTKLCILKNSGVLISRKPIVFKITAQKHQNKTFLVQNLKSFIAWNFAFRKIGECWRQIWQYFSKLQFKNIQIRHFKRKI